MTQTARPQIPWLADLPADDITGYIRASMTAVCRGHEEMGLLLSYFFAGASWKAKNEGIDIETSPCIDLEHTHEDILKKVHISKKSLNNYLKRLAEWGYLEAPKYQRMYRVCCKKIIEAIKNPPEPITAKPRGKYAPAKPKPTEEEINAKKRLDLQHKLVNLQQKVVSLQNKMVSLQQELVSLQPFETAESTSEQDFKGNFEAPRIYRITKDILEDSLVASASAESDGNAPFLSSLSQFEDVLQEGRIGQAPLQMSCIPDRHEEEPVKPAGDSEEPAPSAVHDTTPLQETPTQDTLLPVVQIQTTKPASPNKTHRKENHKISVLSVPKVPPRVIREAIDAIRGYALDQEGPIKHQGVILKGWCQKHTLEDFQHVIEHLTKGRCSNEKHQWWREKNHMKSFFNAAKLAELTPDILSELGYIPKPEAPPEVVPSVEEPKIVGWTPVQRIYPRNGETVTYG